MTHQDTPAYGGEIIVYQAEDGGIRLDVRLEDETVWLTQQMMAELFQSTVPNISMHIRNIFDEGELTPEATVQKFLTVRREGNRNVRRELEPEATVKKHLTVRREGTKRPPRSRIKGNPQEIFVSSTGGQPNIPRAQNLKCGAGRTTFFLTSSP